MRLFGFKHDVNAPYMDALPTENKDTGDEIKSNRFRNELKYMKSHMEDMDNMFVIIVELIKVLHAYYTNYSSDTNHSSVFIFNAHLLKKEIEPIIKRFAESPTIKLFQVVQNYYEGNDDLFSTSVPQSELSRVYNEYFPNSTTYELDEIISLSELYNSTASEINNNEGSNTAVSKVHKYIAFILKIIESSKLNADDKESLFKLYEKYLVDTFTYI